MQLLEYYYCSDPRYSLAEEKFGVEFVRKLPAHLQKDLAFMAETRRLEGLPALSGRQKMLGFADFFEG